MIRMTLWSYTNLTDVAYRLRHRSRASCVDVVVT